MEEATVGMMAVMRFAAVAIAAAVPNRERRRKSNKTRSR